MEHMAVSFLFWLKKNLKTNSKQLGRFHRHVKAGGFKFPVHDEDLRNV